MTDRKQALTDLLAKVEAGEYPITWRAFDCDPMIASFIHNAHNGSLDAAKALHEAVLPGWEWSLDRDGANVWINNPDKGPYPAGGIPARAWLIAIIKALIAEETQ